MLDLRYRPALPDARLCNVAAPGSSTPRIVPRDPQGSELVKRMQLTGPGRMPPFGSLLPDASGIDQVAVWIASLDRCP